MIAVRPVAILSLATMLIGRSSGEGRALQTSAGQQSTVRSQLEECQHPEPACPPYAFAYCTDRGSQVGPSGRFEHSGCVSFCNARDDYRTFKYNECLSRAPPEPIERPLFFSSRRPNRSGPVVDMRRTVPTSQELLTILRQLDPRVDGRLHPETIDRIHEALKAEYGVLSRSVAYAAKRFRGRLRNEVVDFLESLAVCEDMTSRKKKTVDDVENLAHYGSYSSRLALRACRAFRNR